MFCSFFYDFHKNFLIFHLSIIPLIKEINWIFEYSLHSSNELLLMTSFNCWPNNTKILECLESRSYAIAHQSSSQNKFVPRCRSDGSYAAVQCMLGAGCWCSDGQGKPIPNTTTRNGKPNCSKKSKTNIRRSPLRNVNRNKRGCTRSDQGQFNTNLIKVFHTEHNRFVAQNKHLNAGTSVTDKIVLEWKFTVLDTNGNHLLDKIEYRELKRLVKKVCRKCFRSSFGCKDF